MNKRNKKQSIIFSLCLILVGVLTMASYADDKGGTLKLQTEGKLFPTPAMSWEFQEAPFALKQIQESQTGQKFLRDVAQLQVSNGKTMEDLTVKKEKIQRKKDLFLVEQEYSENIVKVLQEVQSKKDTILWTVKVTNTSSEEQWIALRLSLPYQEGIGGQYWDGFESRNVKAAPFSRDKIYYTFPVSMLYGSKHGLCMGVPPHPDTSFLENGIDRGGRVFYGTRFAIPSGQTDKITFLLFAVTPHLGERDAAQGYYQRFPEAFNPFPGVDPRLADSRRTDTLQHAHFGGGITNAARAVAISEWYGGTEWFYTPYYRDGDYVVRPQLWKSLELTEGNKKSIEDLTKKGTFDRSSIEKFLESRQALFRNADLRGNVAPAFYTIHQIETGLAKDMKLEPYLYSRNSDGSMIDSNWTVPYTKVNTIFSWATPYEGILRRDLPEVVKDLNLAAIAHDLYGDSTTGYRGKLDRHMPGWSFDKNGKFISTCHGFRKEVEFIHTLKNNDGRPVGFWANGGGEMLGGFAPDAYMSEVKMTLMASEVERNENISKRLFAGHKPVYQHAYNTRVSLGDHVPWEALTPEECRAVIDDFMRDQLIYLYQGGLIPSWSLSSAVEVIGDELPTLLEVMGRGFEPASASKGAPGLERARYGAKLGAAIVYSNRGDKEITTKEHLIPGYLGIKGVVIPSTVEAGDLQFSLVKSDLSFSLGVPVMESKVITTPLALVSAQKISGQGRSETKRSAVYRNYKVSLEIEEEAKIRIDAAADPGYEVYRVTCNGQVYAFNEEVILQKGHNEIFLETVSSVVRGSEEEIFGFPFEDATIELPANPMEREKAAAQMIQDFMKVRLGKTLPIAENSAQSKIKIKVSRMGDGGPRGALVKGKVMVVQGKDAFDTQQVTWDALRFLDRYDRRFGVKPGVLYGGDPSTLAMYEKAGIQGKWFRDIPPPTRLSWRSFFQKEKEKAQAPVDPAKLRRLGIPLLAEEPVLDGKLEDEIWQKAALADGFTLLGSEAAPTQKTEVYVGRTKDALYIGFKCHEVNMDKVIAEMERRDSNVWNDDDFEVRLAPGVAPEDGRFPYYAFLINASGVMTDLQHKDGKGDIEWNTEWGGKVNRNTESWSGEIRIPLADIGGESATEWRGNFSRNETPNGEYSTWAPQKSEPTNPRGYGILTFK